MVRNKGSLRSWLGSGNSHQRRTREGQRRRTQMADGLVVPARPGNAGGGKEPCPDPGEGRADSPAIDDESTNAA
jgi:hypothetical protein